MIDPAKDKPLYLQIKEALALKILSNEYSPGGRLETENELSNRYGVSRITLRQALSELEKDGLISRIKGKGTFARGTRESNVTGKWVCLIGMSLADILEIGVGKGAAELLEENGYALKMLATGNDPAENERLVRLAVDQGASGMLVCPVEDTIYSPGIDELNGMDYPICLFDRVLELITTDCAMMDHFTAGRMATDHLLDLGHDRLGFIALSSMKTTSIRDRLAGFMAAHTTRRIEPDLRLIYTDADGQHGGWECMVRDLLDKKPRAVVVVNDNLAIDFIRIAGSVGLDVPKDVAVVSFDNWEVGEKFLVPLTTIDQSFIDIGRAAASLLLDRMEGRSKSGNFRWSMIKPSLVIRESCGSGGQTPVAIGENSEHFMDGATG